MTDQTPIDPILAQALDKISDFVKEVTGKEPSPAETADALTRYFVLNEIKDHIVMVRGEGKGS
ncbi:MAG: hypothetical protein CSA23_00070 [Deltaproteobacteria bacterium]|nr:MAG: hypothetical protein CSA23_00070 [Deltaproteobacteria bacterium]